MLVPYTANALPVVGVGLLSRTIGPELAHRIFAILPALLGLVALASGRMSAKTPRSP